MEEAQRIVVAGPAVAVRGHDIDTDRIIPARFLKCVVFEGLGAHAFEDDRAGQAARGRVHPFDDPRHAHARVLLVNRNFGCGSSREHAPQALMRWGEGIQAIVGESFAEIFAGNCLALGLPCASVDEGTIRTLMDLSEREPDREFRLDLGTLEIAAGDVRVPVRVPEAVRRQLLEGRWDSTGELLEVRDEIARVADRLPYFRHWA